MLSSPFSLRSQPESSESVGSSLKDSKRSENEKPGWDFTAAGGKICWDTKGSWKTINRIDSVIKSMQQDFGGIKFKKTTVILTAPCALNITMYKHVLLSQVLEAMQQVLVLSKSDFFFSDLHLRL